MKKYLIDHELIKCTDNQYFLLWVPFRQIPDDDRCILANYYNNEESIQDSLPNDMDVKIGQLLPLLRHLINIQYWVEDGTRKLQQRFNICLDSSIPLARFIYPNDDNDALLSNEHHLKGKVTVSNQDGAIAFAGIERILPAADFAFLLGQDAATVSNNFWTDLQQSRCWSKRLSINEDGDEEFIPDKSIPHCGVVFTQKLSNTSPSAKLTLQWAVFLPLASDENSSNEEDRAAYQQIDCDGEQDYTIFMHGYFFLDSGRKYIEGLKNIDRESIAQHPPQKEDDMVLQWNYLLATKGTLRLLLPSLADFRETHGLSDTAISHLCQGLLKSHLFQSKVFQQSIYFEYQWVFHTRPSANQWQLIDANERVRMLPSIPSQSIWNAFPLLSQFAEGDHYYLTVKGIPNLLAGRKTIKWRSYEISEILNSLEPSEIFSSLDNLSFLEAFLSQQEVNVINEARVQVRLKKILHKAFAEIGITQLQKDNILPLVQKLLALVLPGSRYAIAKIVADEQSVHSILNKLYALNLDLLLVYATFEPNPLFSKAKLNLQQIVKILSCLSNTFQEERSAYKVSQELIQRVLNSLDKPEVVLNSGLQKTPLFFGYNCRDQKLRIYTYSQLQALPNNLFSNPYNIPIAIALKEALPDCDLIFIDPDFAIILNKISSFPAISKCDRNSCLRLLATKQKLADSNKRINLLKELIK
ncbi:hypothetical protein Cri9333_0545 [Crinalium epipsammum PCC 9333]|uniref:Uncharacterized protein n=1 Tax=Crinalium epipsammum PCC 9333 TaxID=1173022 RepID=K9VU60_9CYAN|nr:hypothetical protein [Crinalium epipsammum]AFZ11496.1 hypothetical protein Cri9333_0545 [Crinalium epipsammum PCC 9333]